VTEEARWAEGRNGGTGRFRRTPTRGGVLLTVAVVAVGCGQSDVMDRDLRGLPAFCQAVLPAVERFIEGFESPEGERYGGTVVAAGVGPLADGMNALVSADYAAAQHQTFMNLMTLVQLDETLALRPYLARSWEVSEDGTRLTFHLRDDVHWHDGTPTTAHDVAFTFVRATDPETAFPNAAYWDHYVRGEEGVEVLDDHTVRLHLRPHAEFLDPWRVTSIMPRHLLEEVPPSELRQHPFGTRCPVGNGPFVFREHRADGTWIFVRNPGFPEGLGGPPYLDRYVYRVIVEPTTLLTELLTGEVDLYVAPLPDQASRIRAAEDLALEAFEFRNYVFVAWNSRRPQLADARVRRALTMGANREEILEALLHGYGDLANAGVPPFHWAHYEGIRDSLPHDPDGARALLEQAGWVDRTGDGIRENAEGVRLEFSIKYNTGNQQRQDIAEIMQAQLREIGVAVRPQAVEWATLLEQVTIPEVRDFDGVVLSWVAEFKVDDHDLFHSSKVDQPYAWAGIQDPELDLLLDTLQLVVERDEAVPLWRDYQLRLVELQPFTYFFFPRRLAGVNRRLQGAGMDARGEWVNVARWWVPREARSGSSR
jgi:peptide/nickel transport system substrate-binding protein